jgi:hypothetical protein
MRGLTAALLVIAVLAVGALVISWREDDRESRVPESGRISGQARPDNKPGGMQDRLSHLRDSYDRRQLRGEEKEAPKEKARRPEIPTPSARDKMVQAVGTEDDEEFDEDDIEEVEELRDVILNDPDPDERVGGILMLSGNEHPDAVNTLVKAMNDEDNEVRLAAVEALGDYTETLQPEVLVPALDDPDPEVRFEALGIIGDMETPRAMELVREALDDPDEDVRALAEGILDLSDK